MATGRVPTTANSPLTAKGDLFGYSTTQARVPVGNDGETLVADSSTSTGLRWGANYGFTAGKNKLINGDFRINQRSFSSTTTNDTYTFDRWKTTIGGTTQTYSAQTFTPGTAPVAGYEGTNFVQIVSTTGATSFAILEQRIEDVRTFANQTVTLSFWAKANSGTPLVAGQLEQNFGSGGSSAINSTASTVTISTSWARYSITFTLPSIAGKTIGTGSYLGTKIHVNNAYEGPGQQANTFQIWGVQLEAGSVATAFQTATGTLAGELAACQRYYWRTSNPQADSRIATGGFANSVLAYLVVPHPVTMRVAPTSLDYSTLNLYDYGAVYQVTVLGLTSGAQSAIASTVEATIASGGTQYRPVQLYNRSSTAAYIAFSAEL